VEPPLGRDEELARCDAVLTALLAETRLPASPSALLVSGDAGIGKTTLVRALVERGRVRGAAVGIGHCVDVSGGLPFGPVVEAARQLAGPGVALPGTESPNALGLLVRALAELTIDRPALIVFEDLHWADQYTADFVRAFVRTAEARALLVLTYRSEDVGATATLRETLVDLRRSDGVTLLPLGPLSPAALGALATRRTGRALDDHEASWLHRRSEGNPLYAEEIVAAETSGIPPSLADLLTRHVRSLSPSTRSLVRLAAAASSVLDVETLEQVADLPPETVEAALREALDANVLVRQSRGFAFRHALLRDAVYEDLLPTERVRLHATYVEALRGRLAFASAAAERWPVAADLALHADAAGDRSTALSAHVAAAEAARRYGARADAAAHYGAALRLWPQVPPGDRPTQLAEPDLPRLVAESLFTLGQSQRVRSLLRDALSMLEEDTDPRVASRVYATVASLPHSPADVISYPDAAARALELAGPTPSVERVGALLASAYVAERRLAYDAVISNLDLTRQAAAAMNAPTDRHQYRFLEAEALWYLGRCGEAVDRYRDTQALAARQGDVGASIDAAGELAWSLVLSGRITEAVSAGRQARLEAIQAGLPAKVAFASYPEATALLFTGQLAAARRLLEEMRTGGLVEYRYHELGGELALALGDIESAREHDSWGIRSNADMSYILIEGTAVRRAAILGAVGDVDHETMWARRFLEASDESDSPLLRSIGAYLGLRLTANPSQAGKGNLVPLARRALEFACEQLSPSWDYTWYSAYLSYARAYAARLEDRPALDEWAEGVQRAAGIGAYVALQPRLELAAEHLKIGDRATGKEQLVGVWDDARTMGAGWYERQAASLAIRNRVPLPGQNEAAGPLHRLTPREREVLALLASGATDKDVAATLVISPRTASIHVGNILAKLQVSNRGAAAKLARDLGLDASDA
jgi:DNA-binding CsgD family transcriptional regulator